MDRQTDSQLASQQAFGGQENSNNNNTFFFCKNHNDEVVVKVAKFEQTTTTTKKKRIKNEMIKQIPKQQWIEGGRGEPQPMMMLLTIGGGGDGVDVVASCRLDSCKYWPFFCCSPTSSSSSSSCGRSCNPEKYILANVKYFRLFYFVRAPLYCSGILNAIAVLGNV